MPFELARRALLKASPISSFCRLSESLSTVPPDIFGVGVDEPIFNFRAFGLVGCDRDSLKFFRGPAPSDCMVSSDQPYETSAWLGVVVFSRHTYLELLGHDIDVRVLLIIILCIIPDQSHFSCECLPILNFIAVHQISHV